MTKYYREHKATGEVTMITENELRREIEPKTKGIEQVIKLIRNGVKFSVSAGMSDAIYYYRYL